MKSNKRQVIRLTESDLNNVIKESVKKILNELDPRTYASAAQKLQAKGGRDSNYRLNSKRGNNLANYAAQQFNKQYGNTDDELDMSYDSNNGYDVQGNSSFMKPNGEVKVDNKRQTINNIPQSTRNAYNVAQQMQNGNGQYIKGQGWQ